MESIIEATTVTEPIKKTVRFTCYFAQVCIELEADAGELVLIFGALLCWKFVPCTHFNFKVVFSLIKIAVVRRAELKKVCLIRKKRLWYSLVRPWRWLLTYLFVYKDRLFHNWALSIVLAVKALRVHEQHQDERPHVFSLLFKVSHTFWRYGVTVIFKLSMDVVARS